MIIKQEFIPLLLIKEDADGMYYLYKLYFRDVDINGKIIETVTYAVDPYANSVSVNGE